MPLKGTDKIISTEIVIFKMLLIFENKVVTLFYCLYIKKIDNEIT